MYNTANIKSGAGHGENHDQHLNRKAGIIGSRSEKNYTRRLFEVAGLLFTRSHDFAVNGEIDQGEQNE
jgi:hypothetical protein